MNIDKDIETIKDLIEYSQNMINDMEYEKPVEITIYKEDIQAIENVLSELEKKDKIIKIDEMMSKEDGIYIQELKSELEKYKKAYELETYERQKFIEELETYKKIAEKLADLIVAKVGTRTHICKNMNCDKEKAIFCNGCALDWARKEVEKDE